MSERRYKKNYDIDGWPIEDTNTQSLLYTDDLVLILNRKHDKIQSLEAELEHCMDDLQDIVSKHAAISLENAELRREVERLEHCIQAIHATEESYYDEQTVLCEIYQYCRDAKGE